MDRSSSPLSSVQSSPSGNTHLSPFPSSELSAPPSSPPIPPRSSDEENSDEGESEVEDGDDLMGEDDSMGEDDLMGGDNLEGEADSEVGDDSEVEGDLEVEEESKDGGKNINTPRPAHRNMGRVVGRNSSVAEKTQAIMRQLRKLQLSFGTLVEEAIKAPPYKSQLSRRPELTRSLHTPAQALDMFEKTAHAMYRAELRSMSGYDHFQTWKAEDVDHLQTKASDVVEEMNTRAPRLMSLFRVIARPADNRSRRDEVTDQSRWIAMMAILLYTYMPRTCTRWPTMWGLQLHANGTKRRVIESLYRTGITVGYGAVMTALANLTDIQKARIKELSLGLQQTQEDASGAAEKTSEPSSEAIIARSFSPPLASMNESPPS